MIHPKIICKNLEKIRPPNSSKLNENKLKHKFWGFDLFHFVLHYSNNFRIKNSSKSPTFHFLLKKSAKHSSKILKTIKA